MTHSDPKTKCLLVSKNDKTLFNIIVTGYKENEFVEWKTEDDNYKVSYRFTSIDQNTTRLVYVETGDVSKPFTKEVDWEKLKKVTHLATRFLDDVIEANPYPLLQIRQTVSGIRRIGLGVGGWADMLI